MGKYGPEKTPYLDTFHAVFAIRSRTVNVRIQLIPFINETKNRLIDLWFNFGISSGLALKFIQL